MILRRIGLPLVLLAAPLTCGSVAAAAPATVTPIYHSQELPRVNTLPECFEEIEGEQIGTEVFSGQAVITAGGSLHIRGTSTLDYTVTFPDGRYVTGIATEHISLSFTRSVTSNTVVIVEPRTIYSADHQPTGRVLLHAVSHVTFEAGQLRSSVDRFFFTCL